MLSLRQLFLKHVAQTSESPLLLEVERAEGVYLFGPDGKRYFDLISGVSVSNVGHCHPRVVEAVAEQASKYMHLMVYGEYVQYPQVRFAQRLTALLPETLNNVYFVNSGSEAVEGALKLAKRYTRRTEIISFINAYHGSTHGALSVMGNEEPKRAFRPLLPDIRHIQFNLLLDLDQITERTACVIIEPVVGNMNLIVPHMEFLKTLRELCTAHGTVLIFDEVMTGFRVALGGAQALYNIKPDMTTLGKVIGGGLPVGAFGGRKDIMSVLAPLGPVYQAGTLSGNPVAVTAGLMTLKLIQAEGFYDKLTMQTKKLMDGLIQAASQAGVTFSAQSVGGMFGLYFCKACPSSFAEIMQSDKEAFNKFFHSMLDSGIYLGPSAFEAGFVSAAHTDADIEFTITAAKKAFALLRN